MRPGQSLNTSERRYDFDWLRVLVTGLVVCFHAALIFSSSWYYIKNDPLHGYERTLRAAYSTGRPIASPARVRSLVREEGLSDDVGAALEQLTTSSDRIVTLKAELGNGGVGLKYSGSLFDALRGLERLVAERGERLRVLTPRGDLARAIQARTRILAQPLDVYLRSGADRLNKGEVLFVDWASLMDSRQIEQLARAEDGGRLFLVGIPSQEMVATGFALFLDQWFMMLFFVISGASTWYALGSRTAGQYAMERFKRLFVPFLFGCLVVVPPLSYYGLLEWPGTEATYWQFYPTFLSSILAGRPEWGHLWFIIYLFVYSLLALPLFVYLRGEAAQRLRTRLGTWSERPGLIFLPALPLVLIEGMLRPGWPNGHQNLVSDWANFWLYLLYFVYGYCIASDAKLGEAIDRHFKLAVGLAMIGTAALFGIWLSGNTPDYYYWYGRIGYDSLRGFNSWCLVMVVLGLGRRYLNFNHPVLQYAGEAAYPVYILHQTFVVAIGFYVVRWSTGATQKYLAIVVGCLVATVVVYDLLIKRNNLTRFLFGLKPVKTSARLVKQN